MFSVAEFHYSRRAPQVAALALISVAFAGCSADTQSRFSQGNFSNPFRSETTASVPQQQAPQSAPYGRVERGPQYSSQPLPPPVSAPQSYPSYPQQSGVSGGGRGMSSYTPPAAPIASTGSVAPRSVAAVKPSPASGTTIIVGTSDTLDGLSKRYNVSSAAILQANGYRGPRALQPGQQLIIPRATAQAVPAAPALAAPAIAAAPSASASSTHVVNRGETLMSLSRRYNVPLSHLVKANNLTPTSQLAIGSKVVIPGAKSAPATAAVQPAAEQKPVVVAQAPQTKPATPEPQQKARLASATPEIPESAPAKAAETTSALPAFRWPARGRVIAGYGAKTNGKQNDGINVAVPEGTPVKAAEDGVVAYSGNELKDYGNLVLVRHSNGYVTAYAHASELMVKRGDTIKRGQTIAKSGQTGGVSSPQLHFEIRKGSSPVDPMQFLNGT